MCVRACVCVCVCVCVPEATAYPITCHHTLLWLAHCTSLHTTLQHIGRFSKTTGDELPESAIVIVQLPGEVV